MKLQCVQRNLAVMRHDTEAYDSGVRSSKFQSFFEHSGIASAVHNDVGGEAIEYLASRRDKVVLGRIDCVGGSITSCRFQFVIVQIHRNQGISPGQLRAENHPKANSAAADYHRG